MPIDETKFGELIGTVGALVTAVSDMKAAILPAISTLQKDFTEHKEQDATLTHNVEDLIEWRDGKKDEKGAKRTLEDLERGRIKAVSFIGGIAIAGGAAGHKLADIMSKIWG